MIREKKYIVELFICGCPVCDPVVVSLSSLLTENHELIIYDAIKLSDDENFINKIHKYQIKRIPSVVINGRSITLKKDEEITRGDLLSALN